MPLTKERNPEKLKNMCLYCDRTVDNPCYLDKDTPTQQERTCPIRPMEYREENRADKNSGHCSFCLSNNGVCNLSDDEFSSDDGKDKHCRMRSLVQIYPVIKSTERRRIMNRIGKYKAFFLKHGINIIFMSGINAEGSSGGIGTGSNAIMDLVNPVGGYDDSQPEDIEDIGGVVVKRRGRPSKEAEKEKGRQELIRQGVLDEETPRRKRGRPPKVQGSKPVVMNNNNDNEGKKKRGRPPKAESEVKNKDRVVNDKKSPGNTTSNMMNKLTRRK